jgi:hypothetical protein
MTRDDFLEELAIALHRYNNNNFVAEPWEQCKSKDYWRALANVAFNICRPVIEYDLLGEKK